MISSQKRRGGSRLTFESLERRALLASLFTGAYAASGAGGSIAQLAKGDIDGDGREDVVGIGGNDFAPFRGTADGKVDFDDLLLLAQRNGTSLITSTTSAIRGERRRAGTAVLVADV